MIKTIDDALTLEEIEGWVALRECIEEEHGKCYYCPDCIAVLNRVRGVGDYVCSNCGEIFPAMRRVSFDTHGVTDECPRFYSIISEACRICVCYRGSEGFDVFCAYPE